ncbi:hypothetical protein PMAYCL1PPCAC_27716 [Pristionchus mayeri]|uniref:Uncharacterized protein n=1 Tax=Pristionchus mayeri TaxID=1317129 RepID=A0AAN5D6X1_9BILA|nr:hypothetical protein PMAYCL1PPCAC_11225 [Pristionchus mayeri]GMR44234.1 hypothetical protein PMAYCL1PPCAC_14429 [Pristionchus mayeri]GMR57521.1 hypothetical protein PMAYCL1PPCAC_27716 [Pristionchus mayeri]
MDNKHDNLAKSMSSLSGDSSELTSPHLPSLIHLLLPTSPRVTAPTDPSQVFFTLRCNSEDESRKVWPELLRQ